MLSIKGAIVSAKSIAAVERYAVLAAPTAAEMAVETFGTLLPLQAETFDEDQAREARGFVLGTK